MKTISELLVWFLRQNRSSKWMIGGLGLVILLGLCGFLSVILTRFSQQSPAITATYSGADSVIFITWTPATTNTVLPTSSVTPPVPTRTPLPTGLPTQGLETVTAVILPTYSSGAATGLVVITFVDKKLEYVDIQNAGGSPVDLNGWELVSETGNQTCVLRGILQSKEVLRIWAGTGSVGLSCGFKGKIWLDEDLDPAVLYNADGQEVSRYAQP